jgi:hypothetical protein
MAQSGIASDLPYWQCRSEIGLLSNFVKVKLPYSKQMTE